MVACELPLAILELSKRCECGAEPEYHYSDEVMDSGVAGSTETTADAEFCSCGRVDVFSDEK